MSPEFDSFTHSSVILKHIAGLQLCKGAAAILNKNPIKMNTKPKLNPWIAAVALSVNSIP